MTVGEERDINETLARRLDAWLRRHPRIMMLLVVMVTLLATAVLLAQGGEQAILYEAF